MVVVSNNKWCHLAICVDASKKKASSVSFYIDGKLNVQAQCPNPEKVPSMWFVVWRNEM